MKRKTKKYLRPVSGVIILILGGVFMLLPFIPLGYAFIFLGLFLLVPYVPFFARFMNWLKKKDESNKLEKVEGKTDDVLGTNQENESDKKNNKDEGQEEDKSGKQKSHVLGENEKRH